VGSRDGFHLRVICPACVAFCPLSDDGHSGRRCRGGDFVHARYAIRSVLAFAAYTFKPVTDGAELPHAFRNRDGHTQPAGFTVDFNVLAEHWPYAFLIDRSVPATAAPTFHRAFTIDPLVPATLALVTQIGIQRAAGYKVGG
jgi:hypothetical protein